MTLDNNKTYRIAIKDNLLTFRTTSFKAEKGSVLHSGIYNRELASSLLAGACIVLLGFFFAAKVNITAVHFILSLLLFMALFLFFRRYVFLEPLLEVIIDNNLKNIEFSLKTLKRVRAIYPLTEIIDIKQEAVTITPENPDGIRLVEKVALQHGTVIPGFGKTAEFYTVELEFKNGKRFIIFSSEEPAEANGVATQFINFIKNRGFS
jgi:hypothetical protein